MENTEDRRTLWIILGLLLVYLAASFYMLATQGIHIGGDSGMYINGAKDLIAGESFKGKQGAYIGYVALVALFELCGLGLKGLVVFQILFAIVAGLTLFSIGKRLYSPACGLWAMGLYLWNPDIARWNMFVLSDSLYISLLIVILGSIYRYTEAAASESIPFGVFGLTALTATIRPNGWFLIPVVLSLWICRRFKIFQYRWALLILSTVVMIGGLILFSHSHAAIQDESPYKLLREGVTVWGYPPWQVSMPPADSQDSLALSDGFRYVFRNLRPSIKVAILRLAAELIHLRPFYSAFHNIGVLLFLIPVYGFALIGFRRCKPALFKFGLAAIIAPHLLAIALIAADWDGRFLLYFLPLLLLMAALGLSSTFSKKSFSSAAFSR